MNAIIYPGYFTAYPSMMYHRRVSGNRPIIHIWVHARFYLGILPDMIMVFLPDMIMVFLVDIELILDYILQTLHSCTVLPCHYLYTSLTRRCWNKYITLSHKQTFCFVSFLFH